MVSRACEQVGLTRSRHYIWLNADPKYREAFIEAEAEFTESLIHEAITRGRDGKPKPIIWRAN